MLRKLLGLCLALCVLGFSSFTVVAAELSVEEEIARTVSGGAIKVSSIHNARMVGDHMLYGDLVEPFERWISKLNDKEPWFELTLPQVHVIDTLVLYSGFDAEDDDPYNADTFIIEALQGTQWAQVAYVTDNLEYRCIVTFAPVEASVWRVRFIKSNNWPDEEDNRARIFGVRLLEVK